MDTIQLANYIRHGMMLKNLATHNIFDAIIYETFPSSAQEESYQLPIFTLDMSNQTTINAQLMAYAASYERILVILDTLHLHHIMSFLHTLQRETSSEQKVTIVNIGTGASGVPIKGTGELHDIGLAMEYGWSTFEPYDFISFFSMLNQEDQACSYLRIADTAYAGTLFPDTPALEDGVYDLTTHGLKGTSTTLVCTGPHIMQGIQAHEILAQQNISCDVFLLLQYGLWDQQALLSSLEKTKKLVLLLDQSAYSCYTFYVQSRLFEQGIHDLISFQVITPDMERLRMSPSVSLYEQIGFAPEDIAHSIISS